MWGLKTIVEINKIAGELSKAGKSPSGAIQELSKRRSEAAKKAEAEASSHQVKSTKE